jgi:hypothetical protein
MQIFLKLTALTVPRNAKILNIGNGLARFQGRNTRTLQTGPQRNTAA